MPTVIQIPAIQSNPRLIKVNKERASIEASRAARQPMTYGRADAVKALRAMLL